MDIPLTNAIRPEPMGKRTPAALLNSLCIRTQASRLVSVFQLTLGGRVKGRERYLIAGSASTFGLGRDYAVILLVTTLLVIVGASLCPNLAT